ncbi:MAG TPA: PEP-utilizing enzyme [Candidatus Nanoarchaeia archaeon]|nr:PEP-utilizing enzyme [Candidatus Nanoarchaeia archaeon]
MVVQRETKNKPKRIAYLGVVCDFFHYGHLRSIEFSKSISDYNICGVITDKAVEEYRVKPISTLEERRAIVDSLRCVDRVMIQDQRDCTTNLKKIHEEFPEAEIILVHGEDLNYVPGEEYVRSIGGQVVKHPYYSRLSNFKIINYLIDNKDKFKDIADFTSYIKDKGTFDAEAQKGNKVIISSKADTLKALQPLLTKSVIEPLYSFTISDWKNQKQQVLAAIQEQFSPGKIVVRSSAVKEDTLEHSMAGCFESVLDVNSGDTKDVEMAITKVLLSYKEKDAETSFNQMLVQQQTTDIVMSGVVFTRTLGKNSSYYVINYDDTTGSTDSVTAGRENKSIVISRFAEKVPEKMGTLLEAVQEIEEIIPGMPLDIEFAMRKDKSIVIFQVRPLAANRYKEKHDEEVKRKIICLKDRFQTLAQPQPHLCGETTYFGDMPDWNPAEIIGDNPNFLDYSLYDYLITNSAWHEARTSQGYYNVQPAKLIELFGNKPYVNIRNTFNSFTPAAISAQLREKLTSFYLEKIRKNPYLQDKVEFEVLYTCYDLTFDQRSSELLEAGFTVKEIAELKEALLELTNNLITNSVETVETDLQTVFSMEEIRKSSSQKIASESDPQKLIGYSKTLLDECRKKGTVQFSRLARLGFIGKIILKSLVERGIITQQFYGAKYQSINTVATTISKDFKKLMKGVISKQDFIQEYYHLRPGTYDITSPRYDAAAHLLASTSLPIDEEKKEISYLNDEITQRITAALQQEGLQCGGPQFLAFVEKATQARELSKFEFTKNLSDALELLAKAGEAMGFTRKEIAMLDVNEIFQINNSSTDVQNVSEDWKKLIKIQERERAINDKLVLPSLIFSEQDFEIVQHYQAKPNFITQKKIESSIVNITELQDKVVPNLEGCIVVLENGDPGYDWIFTRNPAGLITKYGGVASHMSIRCAEFGIPAAIGCGDLIFNQVKNAQQVILDCKAQKIIPR